LGLREYPFCKMNIQPPPSSFRMDKRNTFIEKKAQRRRERRRGDRDDDERRRGAKQRTTPHILPGPRRTRTRRGAANGSARVPARRETTMSARQGPSGGGVNPIPESRVLDWILSDYDEGPSSGKWSVSVRGQRSGRGAYLTFASISV
jgi:hypothetical protein